MRELKILTLKSYVFILLCCSVILSEKRRVHIPPLIIDHPPHEIAYAIGESIKLKCEATGVPEVEYNWEMDQRIYSPSGGKVAIIPGVGTLHFNNPQLKDQGWYQCFAKNSGGVGATDKVFLRAAKLDTFTNELKIIKIYVNPGHALVLPCIKPTSYPNAAIFWGNRGGNFPFNQVLTNDRITYSPTGSLLFANVRKEDATKYKGYYSCNSENRVLQRVVTGPRYEIIVKELNRVLTIPKMTWEPHSAHKGVRGRTLKIKCIFSGSPTPEVKWVRYSMCDSSDELNNCRIEPLSQRTHISSFGQELIIENIQQADRGQYQCSGINTEIKTSITRSFSVVVEEAPRWISGMKPTSVNAAIGDTVTFYCKASGIPNAEYVWFIDGVVLKEIQADPRRVADPKKHSLTFTNVNIKDKFVVQCNATNRYGRVYTNAYLSVLQESPIIEQPPLKQQKAAEGQTIKLRCKIFGSPRPQIIWFKGEEQLTGGRFKVMKSGDLQIQDVSLVDAGTYKCYAVNNLGETSAEGSLIVRRRTLIRMAPQDVMVAKGSEVKFTCTAMTDPEEASHLTIDWAKSGEIINYETERRIFKNYMDNSLTISGMQIRDTGTYTCIARNGLDEDRADAMLLVQGPPDEPKSVSVVCHKEKREAVLKWEAGSENYAPILNYIIQYNTTFAPDTWIDYNTTINQSERKWTVFMTPYANYTFRVLARNLFGMSFPSLRTQSVCLTGPALPTKNPENVMGEGDLSENLVIFWTPMPGIEHNALSFNYIVSWRLNGSMGDYESETVTRPEYWNLVITKNIKSYTAYEINVKSRNSEGECSVPPTNIIGYSGERSPRVTPSGIVITDGTIASHSVELSWDNVLIRNAHKINGFFRGYRLQYGRTDRWPDNVYEMDYILQEPKQYPRSRIRRDLSDQRVTFIVDNLPSFAELKLQIRVLTKYYVGPPSEAILFSTPQGLPGPLSSLEIHARGPTHCDLRWAPPSETNGFITAYNISYQTIIGLNLGRIQYREPIEDPNVRQVKLTGLRPNTFYRVYVAASTIMGKGEDIFLDFETTPAGVPQAPTFVITAVNETWTHIVWEPSRNGNPGSIFYIQYRRRGSYDYKHTPDEVIKQEMDLYHLSPGTTYQLRIISKNGEGLETASSWQEFTTNGVGPGATYLWTSGWWYGMWFSQIFILGFVVAFYFIKKRRDVWWQRQEDEIEEQVRQLQAEEAALQMGITNNYVITASREMINQPGPAPRPYKPSQSFDDSIDRSQQHIEPNLINRSADYSQNIQTYQPNPASTEDGLFVRGSTHQLATGEYIDENNTSGKLSGETKDDTFV